MPRLPLSAALRGWAAGLAGQVDGVNEALRSVEALAARQYVSPWVFLCIHTGIRHVDAWRTVLRDCYEQRVSAIIMLRTLPLFDTWRSDPVYQEVVAKLNLP